MAQQIARAESWDAVYQTFQQINFKAFDYNTVKQSLIDHVKIYYPEMFNDYIESSELIAIIELFAYISELYAYRQDVNAHENFMPIAQRKQNVLRLAKTVSYNASRNITTRGLVKITSVQTSETLLDSRSVNLANRKIVWNDPNNENWKEQFLLVINKILEQQFGTVSPANRVQVDDVLFELYTLINKPLNNGVLSYNVSANSKSVPMELVPCALDEFGPYERRPERQSKFSILYASDGVGDSSDYTGFFIFTKQGSLQRTQQLFDGVSPNQTYLIDVANINETDVWINQVDSTTGAIIKTQNVNKNGKVLGYYGEWQPVDVTNSQNVLFNNSSYRNKYELETLEDDKVRVIFGDGQFSDIPNGIFDIWYRQSANETLVINKSEVVNKQATLNYTSVNNSGQTFTFTYSLVNSLANGSSSEDIESIRRLAPAVYYTQDRMVNGQDYNTFPLQDPSILKLKTVNRTFAGDSKYIAWHDPSNAYENVKLFGNDLTLFYKPNTETLFAAQNTLTARVVDSVIQPYIANSSVRISYLINNLPQPRTFFTNTEKTQITNLIDSIFDNNGTGFPVKLYYFPPTTSGYVGVKYKFDPLEYPNGSYEIDSTQSLLNYYDLKIKVDGTQYNLSIQGNQFINQPLSDTVVMLNNLFDVNNIEADVFLLKNVMYIQSRSTGNNSTVELIDFDFFTAQDSPTEGFDYVSATIIGTGVADEWRAYNNDTIVQNNPTFLITRNQDNTWENVAQQISLICESPTTKFWYTNETNSIVNGNNLLSESDSIVVLRANINKNRDGVLTSDLNLDVIDSIIETHNVNSGLVDINQLLLSTQDNSNDGTPDDLLLTEHMDMEITTVDLVGVPIASPSMYTLFELPTEVNRDFSYVAGFEEIELIANDVKLIKGLDYIECDNLGIELTTGVIGNFVAIDNNLVLQSPTVAVTIRKKDYVYYQYDETGEGFVLQGDTFTTNIDVKNEWFQQQESLDPTTVRYRGRTGLNFAWFHVTPNGNLIDPAPTNIHDMFIVTKGYYKQLQLWINGQSDEPKEPTAYELRAAYNYLIDNKMLSDTVVMQSGKFKLLFGSKAHPTLQAICKIIRAPNTTLTDNEIKTNVVNLIKGYFDINTWNFGETFNFPELATVIQSQMPNDIKSIVLVPKLSSSVFGDLYQVQSAENELLQPDISVNDIEIVSSLNSKTLKQNIA